ncbi:OmpA family protein [Acuticoccus mangrovi]|uniref:OmpA family protein n=1 Tax=Acuticoccus mangrovi TaxID=2796142 RepID=A0A934MEC9_9HYPH|nr:OmpA family protein [Acuticoccus mangrovi]MBJ3777357.1 OmpA family protein [Acuticoccus mangrovi]
MPLLPRFAIPLAAAALLTAPAAPVLAAGGPCALDGGRLKSAVRADAPAEVLQMVAAAEAGGCQGAARSTVRRQASAAIAAIARQRLAEGDAAGAEQALSEAPALHWAVIAVRGDVAASRRERAAAARYYNAAIDALTDPAVTPPGPWTDAPARTLAKLAQENMMLAGSLETTLSRGGEPTGALRYLTRGLSWDPDAPADPAPGTAGDGGTDETAQSEPTVGAQQTAEATVGSGDGAAAGVSEARIFAPIRFAFDSNTLTEEGRREAERLAAFLIVANIAHVTLVGHTDEVGDEAYNLELSRRRARSVREALLDAGVAASIVVLGKGESEPPVLTSDDAYDQEERRAIARRVEVVLEQRS